MKEVWTSLASMMGAMAFLQAILHAVLPAELRAAAVRVLRRALRYCFSAPSPYCYFDVTETDGVSTNELYAAVHLYLSTSASVSASSGARLSLSRAPNSSSLTFSLSGASDRLHDTFMGAPCTWEHVVSPRHHPQPFSFRPLPDEKRGFTLRLRRRDRAAVLRPYLDHIMDEAASVRRRSQDRLLYTNARGGAGALDPRGGSHPWEAVPFKHPSTFETLAMDPDRKAELMADLREFAAGGAFYRRTGRAWKRGYLLHGPPGTGKSSMIAAMANYLAYDVYDLELTEVHSNSELRKLLMKTTSKSIIVIEDIDCSLELGGRRRASPERAEDGGARSVTLSGLLNFTDGLWSCCGSERIFVFTTNHAERLDPALLRPGRMDVHVRMGHCTRAALGVLARNYLGWEEGLAEDASDLVDAAEMTPADVSEVLVRSRRKGGKEALEDLLAVMRARADGKKPAPPPGAEEEQEKRALESPKDAGDGDGEAELQEKGEED